MQFRDLERVKVGELTSRKALDYIVKESHVRKAPKLKHILYMGERYPYKEQATGVTGRHFKGY